MKKLIISLTLLTISTSVFAWYTWQDDKDKIYTKDQNQVIDTQNLDDPLNAWTKSAIEWADGIVNAPVDTNDDKQESTLNYISKWINYFLWLIALIVIILIIKDGFIVITWAWDENKQKEAFTNLKNYTIAIIAIGVSFLIVNLIFHFINVNTQNL